jgi:hypothetical protein
VTAPSIGRWWSGSAGRLRE